MKINRSKFYHVYFDIRIICTYTYMYVYICNYIQHQRIRSSIRATINRPTKSVDYGRAGRVE